MPTRDAAGRLAGGNPGNSGGKKGRSGRTPNWLKDWCDELLADPKCKLSVKKILQNPDHTAFPQMWRAVTDRAHGKPKETVELNQKVTHYIANVPAKGADPAAWQATYSQK